MKSSGTAFLLALAGLLTPCAGLHRFYLGRPVSGFFYLLTWGVFGIGTVLDFFRIQRMVDDENRRLLYPWPPTHPALHEGQRAIAAPTTPTPRSLPTEPVTSLEHHILRIAREEKGAVTVSMVALQAGVSLRKAKKELERLRKEGFCSVDVSTDGVKLYVFDGLLENARLVLE